MTDLGYRDLVGSVDALTATARYLRDRPIPRGSETEMDRHHRPQQLADANDPDFRDRSPPGGFGRPRDFRTGWSGCGTCFVCGECFQRGSVPQP